MEAVVDNATVEDVPQELLDLRVQEYTDQFEASYCSDGTSWRTISTPITE